MAGKGNRSNPFGMKMALKGLLNCGQLPLRYRDSKPVAAGMKGQK